MICLFIETSKGHSQMLVKAHEKKFALIMAARSFIVMFKEPYGLQERFGFLYCSFSVLQKAVFRAVNGQRTESTRAMRWSLVITRKM